MSQSCCCGAAHNFADLRTHFRLIHKLIIWGIVKHRFLTALNKITFRKSASIINIYIFMASSPSPVVVWQYILRIYGHYVPAYPLCLEVGPALPPTALHCLVQPVWKWRISDIESHIRNWLWDSTWNKMRMNIISAQRFISNLLF